mmetsp:Transcript_18535/g.28014  ORF Transcript_18535/g.28014 Transcript_18535/m.28014 type:complete len:114 (-) Transcript_18535:117-458(-)|eukprot:CAMPEP_0178932434 /NCGR_PEP_ID=MMETSP0786-20121207/22594_1 /TAXON_ID=186022 /ORGANISM="Thalassionema frauenfeldii, Strain CCMP 1798" /LENGTH=113 /DNA_ID=CAMNT_0020609683 /DNA_START=44 /DNA_END=385 /DNA_ORIENTATION=-
MSSNFFQEGSTTILDVRPTPLMEQQDEVLAQYEKELWLFLFGCHGRLNRGEYGLDHCVVVECDAKIEHESGHPIQERSIQYALQLGELLLAYGLSIFTDMSGPWFFTGIDTND